MNNKLNFFVLSPCQYLAQREQLSTYIKDAIYHGGDTIEEHEQGIANRDRLFMVIRQAGETIGGVVFERDGPRLHIATLAGDLPDTWVNQAFRAFRLLADCSGCNVLQLRGRKAWTRLLKPLGFKPYEDYLQCHLDILKQNPQTQPQPPLAA